jgi:hypothetical protein
MNPRISAIRHRDSKPSMSMAPREAKCTMCRRSCAGHSAPVQRRAAPSSSRFTSEPHFRAEIVQMESFRFRRPFLLDDQKNLRNDLAGLLHENGVPHADIQPVYKILVVQWWRLVTVVPAKRTGCTTARGVRSPVRPTWTRCTDTTVSFFFPAGIYRPRPSRGLRRNATAPAARGIQLHHGPVYVIGKSSRSVSETPDLFKALFHAFIPRMQGHPYRKPMAAMASSVSVCVA